MKKVLFYSIYSFTYLLCIINLFIYLFIEKKGKVLYI